MGLVKPNTDDLGLDQAGIATDARGFIVNGRHGRLQLQRLRGIRDLALRVGGGIDRLRELAIAHIPGRRKRQGPVMSEAR